MQCKNSNRGIPQGTNKSKNREKGISQGRNQMQCQKRKAGFPKLLATCDIKTTQEKFWNIQKYMYGRSDGTRYGKVWAICSTSTTVEGLPHCAKYMQCKTAGKFYKLKSNGM